jgi:hypothetical protein
MGKPNTVIERIASLSRWDMYGTLTGLQSKLDDIAVDAGKRGFYELTVESATEDWDEGGSIEIWGTRDLTQKELDAKRARSAKAREAAKKRKETAKRKQEERDRREYERLRYKFAEEDRQEKR